MKELAIGILIAVGLFIVTIPIRMFDDWLFEKLVCKDCEHYKKENKHDEESNT